MRGDNPRKNYGTPPRPSFETYNFDCRPPLGSKQHSSFTSHWESIMTTQTDQLPGEQVRTFGLDPADFRDAVPVPSAHLGEASAIDLELLVKVRTRLRSGRAGGTDGVTAKFVTALSPDGKEALTQIVRSAMERTTPMPTGWSVAEVALLPHIIGASTPHKLRPITTLPVALKMCMNTWHKLARPFLQLESKASHAFSPSFQSGEVHWCLRSLPRKHDEFGCGPLICKIDIRKAYDTLTWSAIQSTFRRRTLPQFVADACWRMHSHRMLKFRCATNSVRFTVLPDRGIPQCSPESPMVFAAVVEMAIWRKQARPCGVLVSESLDPHDVEKLKIATHTLDIEYSCAFLNVADDTYVLARHTRMIEHQLSTLRATMSMIGQCIHVDKCEALTDKMGAEPGPRPRTWTPSEMKLYLATGHYPSMLPDVADVQYLKADPHMTVLGSEVSLDWHPSDALPSRLRCSWQKWPQPRPQLSNRLTSVASRISLLDSCILPTVLWGLESVPRTTSDREQLDAMQRVMIHRILRLPQRPREDRRDFLRRRERCCTAALRRYGRSEWSRLQTYRALMFMGRISRLGADHLASDALRWRSDRWWAAYRQRLPAKTGGQPGRRAAAKSTPGFVERLAREAFEASLRTMQWTSPASSLFYRPHDWCEAARDRESWRLMCHKMCFKQSEATVSSAPHAGSASICLLPDVCIQPAGILFVYRRQLCNSLASSALGVCGQSSTYCRQSPCASLRREHPLATPQRMCVLAGAYTLSAITMFIIAASCGLRISCIKAPMASSSRSRSNPLRCNLRFA